MAAILSQPQCVKSAEAMLPCPAAMLCVELQNNLTPEIDSFNEWDFEVQHFDFDFRFRFALL